MEQHELKNQTLEVMSGHCIGRSGSRIRRRGTVGRYPPVAWPFSRAAFQLAGHDKIAQRDGFFLAKKSNPLFEPVEWDRVRDNSSTAAGLDQLRGRSAGG